jgi:metallophosphoesterase (TIGR03767 family)
MAEISRRSFLRSSVLGAGAALILSGTSRVGRAVAAVAQKTTANMSIRRGTAGPGGYQTLEEAPALSRVVRTDLGTAAKTGRATCRTGVSGFVQFSDVHVVDHQSPLRVEWLDRYEDPTSLPTPGLLSSAYRPHEPLTAHVAEAMVQATNALTETPVLGLPVAFVIQTGDNSDNSQYNEVRWNIDVLGGGSITPDSGSPDKYEGVMASGDTHYWHPHGEIPSDQARTNHGFPTVDGLLDAARQPFTATGLNVPWYSVFGNHDGLIQGNFPTNNPVMNLIAVGPLKIMSPPAGFNQADAEAAVTSLNLDGLLGPILATPGAAKLVTPDANRRILNRKQVVDEHFTTSGSPVGHGFTTDNRTNGTAYYVLDEGDIRFVVMDTVNANGYADGSLTASQFAWIKTVVEEADDRLVIMASHHTSATMGNPFIATGGDTEQRVMGDALVAYLLTQPQVIAWVNGHTHRNEIIAHPAAGAGFWEINTASHIDFPQQARIIEVADNHDGTLSIFTTILDHAAPVTFDGDLQSPLSLASLSRELSANDWQLSGLEGEADDLNVELLINTPPGYATTATCPVDPTPTPTPTPTTPTPAPTAPQQDIGTPLRVRRRLTKKQRRRRRRRLRRLLRLAGN